MSRKALLYTINVCLCLAFALAVMAQFWPMLEIPSRYAVIVCAVITVGCYLLFGDDMRQVSSEIAQEAQRSPHGNVDRDDVRDEVRPTQISAVSAGREVEEYVSLVAEQAFRPLAKKERIVEKWLLANFGAGVLENEWELLFVPHHSGKALDIRHVRNLTAHQAAQAFAARATASDLTGFDVRELVELLRHLAGESGRSADAARFGLLTYVIKGDEATIHVASSKKSAPKTARSQEIYRDFYEDNRVRFSGQYN